MSYDLPCDVREYIAELSLDNFFLKREVEADSKAIRERDLTLEAKEKELGDLEKKWANALKEVERLEQANRELIGHSVALQTENRKLKDANTLLFALPDSVRVVNIVTEFWTGKPVRTTVYWADGKPTTVTLAEGDTADPYTAFCAAFAKKVFGSTNKVKKLVEDKRTIVCYDEVKESDADAGH